MPTHVEQYFNLRTLFGLIRGFKVWLFLLFLAESSYHTSGYSKVCSVMHLTSAEEVRTHS